MSFYLLKKGVKVEKRHKILVVNDEEEILKVIEEFLTKQGFSVITALGPEKALDILALNPQIDLIVADLRMPRISGVNLIERIRQFKQDIPVIVLTGSIYIERYREALERLNCKDILTKPVDLNILLKKIREKLN